MSALQIRLFMQNKAKFRKSQMNISSVNTMDYDKMDTWLSGKNEPKTNPKRTQTNPKRTQLKQIKCQNKPNTNPTCRGVASGEAGTNPISEPIYAG
jgi:hypothetical protein